MKKIIFLAILALAIYIWYVLYVDECNPKDIFCEPVKNTFKNLISSIFK